ncbi:MAG: XshC-Cox1-family protein [Aquimarina sp.]|nr:XshC-Cox1-family protein [Aquimarina sp.]
MTHEFKEIIYHYKLAKQQNVPAVLATVVYVDGSSYRRPGVRMLILENGKMVGAVSGGCVEKEVKRQADSVFRTGLAKVMTYDGKYRLGCEGVLYILIEKLEIKEESLLQLEELLSERKEFSITSFFKLKEQEHASFGSVIFSKEQILTTPLLLSNRFQDDQPDESIFTFEDVMKPCLKLVIGGGEHDAVELCKIASLSGWEVDVVLPLSSPHSIQDFPGAMRLEKMDADSGDFKFLDHQTAIVLMTHNFAKDSLYLNAVSKNGSPFYIGLLGPAKRREKLLEAVIEYNPDVSEVFLEKVNGPAGINIGAETPQEIAISILAEILAIHRNQNPMFLQDKKGAIHDFRNDIAVSNRI